MLVKKEIIILISKLIELYKQSQGLSMYNVLKPEQITEFLGGILDIVLEHEGITTECELELRFKIKDQENE